jgi:DNA-binding CsgD family transcriptional regulator
MVNLIFTVVFIFCAAVAAAAVLIGHRFISTYNTSFNRNYFYYLVTFYAFAFYGIWGHILVKEVLAAWNTDAAVIQAVAGFLPVLGIPFLFISWIMLIKTAYAFFDQNIKNIWLIFHGVFLTSFMAGIWLFFTLSKPHQWMGREQLIRYEVISLLAVDAVYFLIFSSIVVYKLRKNVSQANRFMHHFVLLMGIGMLMRESLLSFLLGNTWVLAASVFLYFSSNFLPLFYLNLKADQLFKPLAADQNDPKKMDRIYKKYNISKREKEIIEQICAGKTNQQIADALFISLQTVKDHTHRIYTKTGINSRMKLVHMVTG